MTVPLVVAGCGGDEVTPPGTTIATSPSAPAPPPATDPPATAAPGTSTTTGAPGDEAEVRAVIDRFWDAYLDAVSIPDAGHEALASLLRGDAQQRILAGIDELEAAGQRIVATDDSILQWTVMSVTFDERGVAVVDECVVDDLTVLDADGTVLDDTVVTVRIRRALVREPDGWRITSSEQVDERQGVHPCDVWK